jgi:20S proteasome alpha/beta subunit
VIVAAIETEILEEFYGKLEENEAVPESVVKALRALLDSDAKLKADDLVRIFTPPSEEQIP